MKLRSLTSPITALALAAVLVVPSSALGWSPSSHKKVKWPSGLKVPNVSMQRIQTTKNFLCEYGKGGGFRFVYAAGKKRKGFELEDAVNHAKSSGKFNLVEESNSEIEMVRGGKIAWISFSIRASPTNFIIRPKGAKVEMFYKLDVPPTSITTAGDWEKICDEASGILAAAN